MVSPEVKSAKAAPPTRGSGQANLESKLEDAEALLSLEQCNIVPSLWIPRPDMMKTCRVT